MDREELARRLLRTFLGELEEHVQSLNEAALALERGPEHERPAQLRSLLRSFHSLKGAARTVRLPAVEAVCHRLETLLTSIRDGATPWNPQRVELLFAAADAFKEAGESLAAGAEPGGRLEALLARLEEEAPGPGPARPPSPPAAPPAPGGLSASSVRVPVERLDLLLARGTELMLMRRNVGERLTAVGTLCAEAAAAVERVNEAMGPSQRALARGGTAGFEAARTPGRARVRRRLDVLAESVARLRAVGKSLERSLAQLTSERRGLEHAAQLLEDDVRRTRLVPFAELCEGLERVARDAARALGREVELVVVGGAVVLDRRLAQRLRSPLQHLVRNAVAHGIEAPARRVELGKGPTGRVEVQAALRGSGVELSIADDGAGLDLPAIRAEATRRQLPVPEDLEAVAELLFRPGFTTAKVPDELSGRGVGLDVVKGRIEALHGTVRLASTAGRGTRFVLTVPLTLTTLPALLVRAGGRRFALPALAVRRLVRASTAELVEAEGRSALAGEAGAPPVPVASLAELLGLPGPRAALGSRLPFVVLEASEPVAVQVDELVGEQELLVQPLSPALGSPRGLAGASLLPSGQICLVLSPAEVAQAAARTGGGADRWWEARAKQRVLLVDDSATVRAVLTEALEAQGYAVVAVGDAESAWEALGAQGPDLVVTDLELPRADGLALTRSIRARRETRALPVLVFSSQGSEAERELGRAAGVSAWVLKAEGPGGLLERMARLTG